VYLSNNLVNALPKCGAVKQSCCRNGDLTKRYTCKVCEIQLLNNTEVPTLQKFGRGLSNISAVWWMGFSAMLRTEAVGVLPLGHRRDEERTAALVSVWYDLSGRSREIGK